MKSNLREKFDDTMMIMQLLNPISKFIIILFLVPTAVMKTIANIIFNKASQLGYGYSLYRNQ